MRRLCYAASDAVAQYVDRALKKLVPCGTSTPLEWLSGFQP